MSNYAPPILSPVLKRSPHSALVLFIILACQLMLIIDGTVIYTALPHIQTELEFSIANLSWVHNIYALTFGGFILFGARAGDIIGHRRVFFCAVAIFTLASAGGGLASSATWLIIARGIQGLAAAFAAPLTLALLMTHFPQNPERMWAIKLYTAVSGAGSALGLVLGGALADIGSWRWLLFINVPIGLVLLGLAPLYFTETSRQRGRFDLAGAFTSTLGMSALVYGLVACATPHGWKETMTIVSFLVGALLLIMFIWIEGKAAQPLVPLHLFASAQRSGAYVCRMLLVGGMLGMFFFLTQYVQNVLGFNTLETGFAFLTLALTQFTMVMAIGPRLATLIGRTWLLTGGFLIALIGMGCLNRVGVGASYFPELFLPLFILGIGAGATLVPLTISGITGVTAHQSGAASGLVNAAHQLGGSLGTAIIVAVVGMHSQQLDDLPTTEAIQLSLSQALGTATTVAIVFFALAIIITITLMRDRKSTDICRRCADL